MNLSGKIIAQNQAVELLQRAVANNRIAPAYLFIGPSGVGKGLTAKYFSEILMEIGISSEERVSIKKRLQTGNHPDLLWVEPTYLYQGKLFTIKEAAASGLKRKAPPHIRIEQIREIIQFLGHPPLEASRSVVVIEASETMAESAANALLKTLEEPGRATLILIAPSSDALLSTLVSRCQPIPFYRLASDKMKEVLKITGHEDILQHKTILAIAQGSPGEAILSFNQLKLIPQDLLQQLIQPPHKYYQALTLAKEINKTLDIQTQLWLIAYLQHSYWQKWQQKSMIEKLEKTRQFLLSYVQPRLVWEVTLLTILQEFN